LTIEVITAGFAGEILFWVWYKKSALSAKNRLLLILMGMISILFGISLASRVLEFLSLEFLRRLREQDQKIVGQIQPSGPGAFDYDWVGIERT
jgi:hypothetical protein